MERAIAVIKPKGVNHIKQAVTLTATYNLEGQKHFTESIRRG
jgi:hypothetical protein